MNSKKLGSAFTKATDIALTLLRGTLYRTHIEPIRDTTGIKGIKARWIADPGENVVAINTPSGNTDVKIEGDTAPALEYTQEGEKRTIAVRHIQNLSCEVDQETLDRIATPKGAGLAVCIGAGVGLFAWCLVSILRALPTSPAEKQTTKSLSAPTAERRQ